MAKPIEPGCKAPAFTLLTDGGGKVRLADYAGRKLVLYFYPKDDTSGCTREAIDFTAAARKFKTAGAEILGVSKDSVEKHDKFKAKHDLKITLGADEDARMIEKYGVWVEKNLYGRKYMGIERATFLIDEKGVVREVWRKVKVPGHVDKVLEAVKAL
ncbi:MAG: peroxiredoxin [Parvularculaceae bacterium]|nr:peroxiredoxin [Parvularculaceae bacterium]